MTVYEFVKDFQNMIGTLVGFGGVCLTLYVNNQLTDRKRTDDISHDRTTTRVTLSSELSIIHRSLTAWKEVFQDLQAKGQLGLPRSFDAEGASRAYRAVLPKIGLLTEREIQQVVLAYSEYEALSKMSHDVQEQLAEGSKREEKPMAFLAYVTALNSTVAAADEALDALKQEHIINKVKAA